MNEEVAVKVTQSQLARLLKEAELAHGQYEKTLGERDEEWPQWYAGYIVSKLEHAP